MKRMMIGAGGLGTALLLAAAALPGDAQDPGKAIFTGKGTCFVCHGAEGKGTPIGPALTDSTWINFAKRPTVEEVQKLVKTGVAKPVEFPAAMPPMGGGQLSDAEIAAVAGYVLKLSAPPGS